MFRGLSLVASVAVLAFTLAWGCSGDAPPSNGTPPPPKTDPNTPCTDPQTCCKPEELKCTGDGEKTPIVCTCRNLWDCDLNKSKCSQPISTPDGGGGWNCKSWNEFQGTSCEKAGTQGDVPSGGSEWSCRYDAENGKILCTQRTPANPSNTPTGASQWNCVPVLSKEGVPKLECSAKTAPPPVVPPPGGGQWSCTPDKENPTKCTKTDGDKGLPGGTGSWSCYEDNLGGKPVIVCSGGTPPAGTGEWTCAKSPSGTYVCTRPKTPNDTPAPPTGGGSWACARGTEFSGTVCTQVPTTPVPPTPFPTGDNKCIPGKKRWCDGLQYCGWGLMTCKPDGTWPTTVVNGKVMYDCQETKEQRRPSGECACYHFYFNAKCCERPDCMVPDDQDQNKPGQVCAPSAGGQCDYCNPQKSECKGAGSKCIISNTMQTFCATACGPGDTCDPGYKCYPVKGGKNCIKSTFSCWPPSP